MSHHASRIFPPLLAEVVLVGVVLMSPGWEGMRACLAGNMKTSASLILFSLQSSFHLLNLPFTHSRLSHRSCISLYIVSLYLRIHGP
ncbi:hypothetical protein BXZ70DRAFT_932630 [Cristinia sonorae]|uniref:Uncharacterized protein n=1 Tax=Cristinia sonorae TaxID=1940300 RepID=A0A8K0URS5_9AGAR|nr:hypothetical protein BXZ70DRAFT_932630 [Cristinia sonorae]